MEPGAEQREGQGGRGSVRVQSNVREGETRRPV